MLRGPEVSLQAEDGGGEGGLLQAHIAAWICMNMHGTQVFLSSVLRWWSAAERRSSCGWSVLLPWSSSSGGSARRGFVGVFAGSCHIQPVPAGPGEIEIYTAELLVQREAVTQAADIMSGILVSQPPTDALKFIQRRVCLPLKQKPSKVKPAFAVYLKTVWYYSLILLQYICIVCII